MMRATIEALQRNDAFFAMLPFFQICQNVICLIVSWFNLKSFLRYFKQVFSHFLEFIPFCALIFVGCIWLFSEWFRYCFRMSWRCSSIFPFDKKDLLNFFSSSKCLSPLIDAFSIPELSSFYHRFTVLSLWITSVCLVLLSILIWRKRSYDTIIVITIIFHR